MMAYPVVRYSPRNLPIPYRSFGDNGAQTGAEVISYTQKGVGIVSSVAATASITGAASAVGGAALGAAVVAVAAVAGYVGLALAVIYVVYSLIMGHQAEVKANRKIREAHRTMMRDIGVELIGGVYGMAIPDWSFESEKYAGEYLQLGGMFYWFSKSAQGTAEYERGRHMIAVWLRDRGLDPTRLLGGPNVKPDEELIHLEMFVAIPEKMLTTEEALQFLGYDRDIVTAKGVDFSVRIFDMIQAMGRTKTETQAQAVRNDISNWLMAYGLDPNIFFAKGTGAVPSPVASSENISAQSQGVTGGIPETSGETQALINQSPTISPNKMSSLFIVALVIGGGALLLSRGKS